MEQIKFIYKKLVHLAIAVLAIVCILLSGTSDQSKATSEERKDWKLRTDLYRVLWGKQVELEVVRAPIFNYEAGTGVTGIFITVRNNSIYPVDQSSARCWYTVASRVTETKVRNGVATIEPLTANRHLLDSGQEQFRIEPGQTVTLNFKALPGGFTGNESAKDVLSKSEIKDCYVLSTVQRYDAIEHAFRKPYFPEQVTKSRTNYDRVDPWAQTPAWAKQS